MIHFNRYYFGYLWIPLIVSAQRRISSINLPSFLKICHQSDPQLEECLADSIERLRPHLARGISELMIPPCEPLVIPEVVMNQGKGSVNVQSTYRNIKIYGPTNFILRSIKVDLSRDRARVRLWFPQLQMTSDYTIDGRILVLPIAGRGYSEGNYTNIDATATMQCRRLWREGRTYLDVASVAVDFNIGHASVFFSNLFNGDQELGNAMNVFLNDNWKNVAQDVKPILEETIGELLKRLANKIYHRYPLDELLPM